MRGKTNASSSPKPAQVELPIESPQQSDGSRHSNGGTAEHSDESGDLLINEKGGTNASAASPRLQWQRVGQQENGPLINRCAPHPTKGNAAAAPATHDRVAPDPQESPTSRQARERITPDQIARC